jgi:hypothetical protein
MKTSLIVMCLALLPMTAQNNSVVKHLTVGTRANGRPALPRIRLAARNLQQSAGLVYLKGSIEINLPMQMLLADRAEYDQDSGEIQACSNQHLKPANLDSRGANGCGSCS